MVEKRRGLRGWLIRRTPLIITALGYVLGISVLVAAASTVVIETTIMAGCTGTAEAHVTWLCSETPAIVLSLETSPGSEVASDAPVARVIDTPEQVKRAHYLQQLEEGLSAMAMDDKAPPQETFDALKRTMRELAAGLTVRTVNAPHQGWVVRSPYQPRDGRHTPLEEGQPFAGIANLDHVSFTLTVADTRPPTVSPGDRVALLLPEWSVSEVPCRARDLRVTVTVEMPRSTLSDTELSLLDSGNPVSVRLRDVVCSAQPHVQADSVTLKISVEGMPKDALKSVKVGRNMTVALVHSDATPHSARIGAIETNLLLDTSGQALPEAFRTALISRLREGVKDQQVSQAWVEIRRTTLFARLFGN